MGVGLWEEYVGTLPFHRIMHHATDSMSVPGSVFFSRRIVHESTTAYYFFTLSLSLSLFSQPLFFF